MSYSRGRRSYDWEHAGLNYAVNVGSGTGTSVDYGDKTDGLFWRNSHTKFRNILVATSSTIMMGETLMGVGFDQGEVPFQVAHKFVATTRGRSVSDMMTYRDNTTVTDPHTFIENHSNWRGLRGANWISGFGSAGGSINGRFTPNHPLPDLSIRAYQATATRSNHEGGVHIGLSDGSVNFITDSIDLETYRALWTVRGKEFVGEL